MSLVQAREGFYKKALEDPNNINNAKNALNRMSRDTEVSMPNTVPALKPPKISPATSEVNHPPVPVFNPYVKEQRQEVVTHAEAPSTKLSSDVFYRVLFNKFNKTAGLFSPVGLEEAREAIGFDPNKDSPYRSTYQHLVTNAANPKLTSRAKKQMLGSGLAGALGAGYLASRGGGSGAAKGLKILGGSILGGIAGQAIPAWVFKKRMKDQAAAFTRGGMGNV